MSSPKIIASGKSPARLHEGESSPPRHTDPGLLAVRLTALGRHKEAHDLAADALERRRRVLGEDHPDTLTSANNLAIWRPRPGRRKDAHDLGSDTMFSDDAADLIHQTSRGPPRAVNNLALQALVATYLTDKTIVDQAAARAAVTEVTAD